MRIERLRGRTVPLHWFSTKFLLPSSSFSDSRVLHTMSNFFLLLFAAAVASDVLVSAEMTDEVTCHCADDHDCNSTGACSDDACAYDYWSLPTCESKCDMSKDGGTMHCYASSIVQYCDDKTGYCSHGCEHDYWGPEYCRDHCDMSKDGGTMHCYADSIYQYCDDETGYCSHGCDHGYFGKRCDHDEELAAKFHKACIKVVDFAFEHAAGVAETCEELFSLVLRSCSGGTLPLDEIPVLPEAFCLVSAGYAWHYCEDYGLDKLKDDGLDALEKVACSAKTWFPEWDAWHNDLRKISKEPSFAAPAPSSWPNAFTLHASVRTIENNTVTNSSFVIQFSAESRIEEQRGFSGGVTNSFVSGFQQFCAPDGDTLSVVSFGNGAHKCVYTNTTSLDGPNGTCTLPVAYLDTFLARYAVNSSHLLFNRTTEDNMNIWIANQTYLGDNNKTGALIRYLANATDGTPVGLEAYVNGTATMLMDLQILAGEPNGFSPVSLGNCTYSHSS